MAEDRSSETTVSAAQARELIAGGKGTVLDLRSDEEWERVGNIAGSVRASDGEPAEAAKGIDDDCQVIVVCADGKRSAEVAEELRGSDRDAVSIEGGIEAWQDEKLPLQPSEDPDLPGDPGSVEDESGGEPESGDAEDESSDQPPSSG